MRREVENQVVVRACSYGGVERFPRGDGCIELRAPLQGVFEPVDLGNVADLMRDLGENIVVERVATNEVAKCSEGGELFFDVIFDEEDVGCLQCAENGGDVHKQLAARQRDDACMSAEPFDGGEVECTDAVNHGLMKCHACCRPFFPLELVIIEEVDDGRPLFVSRINYGPGDDGTSAMGDGDVSGGGCGGYDIGRVALPFWIV